MGWKMLLGLTLSMVVAANASCTEQSCVNGYCNDNTGCRCYHGFTMDPNGVCVPFDRCTQDQCRYGVCSHITFVCTCQGGYTKDPNGNCVPIERCAVDSCPNGFCSSSGQCFCKSGYFKGPNGVCLAVAPCDPDTCVNGQCDPITQACKCKPGFEKNINGRCAASTECTLTCENGQCAKLRSQQEVCYCHVGYTNHPENTTNCVSVAGQGHKTTRTTSPSASTSARPRLNSDGDRQNTSPYPQHMHTAQQDTAQTKQLPPTLISPEPSRQDSAPHKTPSEVSNKPPFHLVLNRQHSLSVTPSERPFRPQIPLPPNPIQSPFSQLSLAPPENVKGPRIPLSPNPIQSPFSQFSLAPPENVKGPRIPLSPNPIQSPFSQLSLAPPENVNGPRISLPPNPIQSPFSQLSLAPPENVNGPRIPLSPNPIQSMFPRLSLAPSENINGALPLNGLKYPFPASTRRLLDFLRALSGNVGANPANRAINTEAQLPFRPIPLDSRSTSMLMGLLSMNQFMEAIA
ncbi:uncharacterized protein [Haliotis cracherodii]|uniref:uncharacterized protein n=1 Tax=Haliotis cracherodii TaxID=6455 RepID=UPI0039EA452D